MKQTRDKSCGKTDRQPGAWISRVYLLLALVMLVLTLKTWFYGSVLLTPALSALAVSFLLEPVLRRYTPQAAEGEDTPWYLR